MRVQPRTALFARQTTRRRDAGVETQSRQSAALLRSFRRILEFPTWNHRQFCGPELVERLDFGRRCRWARASESNTKEKQTEQRPSRRDSYDAFAKGFDFECRQLSEFRGFHRFVGCGHRISCPQHHSRAECAPFKGLSNKQSPVECGRSPGNLIEPDLPCAVAAEREQTLASGICSGMSGFNGFCECQLVPRPPQKTVGHRC
jgi:hypothetical protein